MATATLSDVSASYENTSVALQALVVSRAPNGFWPLDDGSGATSARDLSGNNRPFPTIGAGVTPGAPPPPGATGAFTFNGSATAFLSGVAGGAFHVAPLAWEVWLDLTSTAHTVSNFFTPGGGANGTWRLLTSSGQLQYNNNGVAIGGGGNLFGAWHLVGIAIDGSGNCILVVDGVQLGSFTGVSSAAQSSSKIGSNSATLAPVGRMANFASYSSLTAAQFAATYAVATNAIQRASQSFNRSISDSSFTTDSLAKSPQSVARSLSDSSVSTEVVKALVSRPRSLSDTSTNTDALTRITHLFRVGPDTSLSSDVLNRQSISIRGMADFSITVDGLTRTASVPRLVVDQSLTTEVLRRAFMPMARVVNDFSFTVDVIAGTFVRFITVGHQSMSMVVQPALNGPFVQVPGDTGSNSGLLGQDLLGFGLLGFAPTVPITVGIQPMGLAVQPALN